MQVRRLPAYNNSGIVGNIQNRQRIMSTPSYTQRPRTSSQGSSYSRRYSSQTRVVSTHIPDHLDKKLVRSRSTGVISEAEMKMHKTPSASVVKLSECEDWIVWRVVFSYSHDSLKDFGANFYQSFSHFAVIKNFRYLCIIIFSSTKSCQQSYVIKVITSCYIMTYLNYGYQS